ncbi:MAG: hypothetical protein WC732_04620 [Candidatus Omnitrophota bacterium]
MSDIRALKNSADFIIHRLLAVFFFSILAVYCSREIADLDIWLHLKTGEVIFKTGHVPLRDIFSFTLQGKPWVNHEWLFQLLAYFSTLTGGPDGLIVMQNLVFIAVFLLLLFFSFKETHPVFIFIVLYLTLLAMTYRFTVRPDMFSLLFLSLYLFLLKKFPGRQTLWLLPALQIIWGNMHGFSFLGPLVVFLFLLAEAVKRLIPKPLEWKTNALDFPQIRTLLVIFCLMILASLINPGGLRGAVYPLTVLSQISNEGKLIFQYIQELARPISWHNILDVHHFLYYKILILLSLFSFRVNFRHLNITNVFLEIFFLAFSLLAIRNVAYFSLVAAFIIFENFSVAFKNGKTWPRLPWPGANTLAFYGLVLFLFYYPAKGTLKYVESATFSFDTYELKSELWGISNERFPSKAVDFLLKHPFPRVMFNDFNSGSYLIGRAYPFRQVFIDGRTELYGPEFFKQYVETGEGKKEALDALFDRYAIKGFFLSNPFQDLHLGLIRYLFYDPAWVIVYFDENSLIFLLDIPENASLIRQFGIDLKTWQPPSPDLLKIGIAQRFPGPFLRRAHLLNALECFDAARKEAQQALSIMPNNGEAYLYLQNYFFDKGDYPQAYKYARLNLLYGGRQPWMRARLALIYHHLKEDDKARKVIASLIKNQPKYAQAYYVQALILKESDLKNAVESLKKAVALSEKEPKYAEALGDLLDKQGDREEALKYWKKAFEYNSASPGLKIKTLGLSSKTAKTR